jgi:glycosyltransferase involved in cell wall biosynthesis
MVEPLVTVICICYNQSQFVREAIHSVMSQTYPRIQLLVVDDASTDNSVEAIRDCVAEFPAAKFLPLSVNSGNCRAFNSALTHAQGKYIIDLAADDVLLPERVAVGVKALEEAGEKYGVSFCDAEWITADGKPLYKHSDRFPHETIPQGDVYKHLIERFFICSPTMMFKASVIRSLGGYDESLHYEDFDFWIRSSRSYFYCYTPRALVKKRVVKGSMSQRQFGFFSPQLRSTYRVCEKILALNRLREEQSALSRRIRYEMRVSLRFLHFPLLFRYARLLLMNWKMRYRE